MEAEEEAEKDAGAGGGRAQTNMQTMKTRRVKRLVEEEDDYPMTSG